MTLCSIHFHHKRVNRLRTQMGQHPIRYQWLAEKHPRRADRILTYWLSVHKRTRSRWHRYLLTPWLHGGWHESALCVHHYEGAWDSNTGDGYYGGMQFDLGTWQSNGGAGRPDLAPPSEQLHIAYKTWQARGWSPWPNTAAACGLL